MNPETLKKKLEELSVDYVQEEVDGYLESFRLVDHNFVVQVADFDKYNTDSDPKASYNAAITNEQNGLETFSVFPFMEDHKILEMIEHRLKGSRRVFARKCKVSTFGKAGRDAGLANEAKKFIANSHILGFLARGVDHYTVLRHNGEIVGAAAWGKPRQLNIKAFKAKKEPAAYTRELIRMVFKPGVSVPGGASKMLKDFIRTQGEGVREIFTFSDYDLGWGDTYGKIGFDLIEEPKAQLLYVHPDPPVRADGRPTVSKIKHTSLIFAGSDRLLANFPGYKPVGLECLCENEHHEDRSCLPTNGEIVQQYGFVELYDCGYKKWVYRL